MKWFLTALCVLGLLCAAIPAKANGRFPAAGHVEVDPADPAHIVLRTTYGLVVTRDGGNRWDWVCEKVMSFGGMWDPPIGIMTGGVIMVGLPDGLSLSTPDACQYSRIEAMEGRFVADVAVDKTNPSRAVVLTLVPLGFTFDTRLFLTEDGGSSFTQAGDVFPDNFRGLTVDLSPSDANVVYVSGVLEGSIPQGVVLRSTDGGVSYEMSVVSGSDKMTGPFIGAVDPQNANRVYVRLDGTPGHLLVSDDGSKTWQEIFTTQGPLLGFSLSPDGKTVVVGGEMDGVWRSPTANWAFERTSLLHAKCLRWADAGIYACAEQVLDGFSVGLSVTEGSTFGSLSKLSDLCGPLPCPTPICSSDWPILRETIGAMSCTATGSSTSGANGGTTGGPNDPPPATAGCACRMNATHDNDHAWTFLTLITLYAWRKRLFRTVLVRPRSGRTNTRVKGLGPYRVEGGEPSLTSEGVRGETPKPRETLHDHLFRVCRHL